MKKYFLFVLTLLPLQAWCDSYDGDEIVTIAIEQPDGRKVDVTFKYGRSAVYLVPLTTEHIYRDGKTYRYDKSWGSTNGGGLNPIKIYGFSVGDGRNCAIDPQFEGSLSLPDSIVVEGKKYPILNINDNAFENCRGLESFSAPILGIGSRAFSDCKSLKSVWVAGIIDIYDSERSMWVDGEYHTFHYSTTPSEIRTLAFSGCYELTEFRSNGCFSYIGDGAFKSCRNLKTMPNLPPSNWLDRYDKPISIIIEEDAFSFCGNLTSIHIPATVTSIGEKAFSYCGSVKEITVDENNPTYDSRNGCNALIETASGVLMKGCENTVIPDGVTIIREGAFANGGWPYKTAIPSTVTKIGEYAFSNCYESALMIEEGGQISHLEIPSSVVSIGYAAFGGAPLVSVSIPSSVAELESSIFKDCEKLKTADLADLDVLSIPYWMFRDCKNLEKITMPKELNIIEMGAFSGCENLESIKIPQNLETIERDAFYGCKALTSVTIPMNVSIIENNPFPHCSRLKEIIVDSKNKTFDSRNGCNAIIRTADNALVSGCQNTVIPNNVKIIEQYAFNGCTELTEIDIPEGVETICENAFINCFGVERITLPSTITEIKDFPEPYYWAGGTFGANYHTYDNTWIFPKLKKIISYITDPFEIAENTFKYVISYYGMGYQGITDLYGYPLYVPTGTKEKYGSTKGWNLFRNIVEMDVAPVDDNDDVDFGSDINEYTDLDGNIIRNIYYNVGKENGGYDTEEGCIVITKPTDDGEIETLQEKSFFDKAYKIFAGLVLVVPEGGGVININAKTVGNITLKVKIGNNAPVEVRLNDKEKVSFPYSVTKDDLVYIYGGTGATQAKGLSKSEAEENALKIYSVEFENDVPTGIGIVTKQAEDNSPMYNLNGQRVKEFYKGVVIRNGKKVLKNYN